MNSQITKLFAVIVLLFGVLIYFTSRWTVFSATALNANALNARPQIEQLRIKRGSILANFVLIALLLLVSDRARRPEPRTT